MRYAAKGALVQKMIEYLKRLLGFQTEPETQEVLLEFLSKNPGTQEYHSVEEEIDFLKDLRPKPQNVTQWLDHHDY